MAIIKAGKDNHSGNEEQWFITDVETKEQAVTDGVQAYPFST
jgi:hypothetical protein